MLNITSSIIALMQKLGFGVNSGMNLENAFNTSAAQVGADGIPAVPFVLVQSFADAATGDTVITAPCPAQFRVIDFMFENRGANGANANLVQLCAAAAGASPISDAMSTNGKANKDLVRALDIDVSVAVIAAGGNLYIRRTRIGGVLTGEARILCIAV